MSNKIQLKLEILTDKKVYEIEEPIRIKILLKNTSNDKLTLTFRSAKIVDINLLDKNKKLIKRWSEGKFFAQMINDLTLEPNETVEKTITWNVFREALVTPGEYYIEVFVKAFQGEVSSNPIKISIINKKTN